MAGFGKNKKGSSQDPNQTNNSSSGDKNRLKAFATKVKHAASSLGGNKNSTQGGQTNGGGNTTPIPPQGNVANTANNSGNNPPTTPPTGQSAKTYIAPHLRAGTTNSALGPPPSNAGQRAPANPPTQRPARARRPPPGATLAAIPQGQPAPSTGQHNPFVLTQPTAQPPQQQQRRKTTIQFGNLPTPQRPATNTTAAGPPGNNGNAPPSIYTPGPTSPKSGPGPGGWTWDSPMPQQHPFIPGVTKFDGPGWSMVPKDSDSQGAQGRRAAAGASNAPYPSWIKVLREYGDGQTEANPKVLWLAMPDSRRFTEANLQETEQLHHADAIRLGQCLVVIRAAPHEKQYSKRLPNGSRQMVTDRFGNLRPLLVSCDLHSTVTYGRSLYELFFHGHRYFWWWYVFGCPNKTRILKPVKNPANRRERPNPGENACCEEYWLCPNVFPVTGGTRRKLVLQPRTLPIEQGPASA